jgi:coenzyme F420-reducing hydrogenase gamma subunit
VKPKVAVFKFASCDGCQLQLLNLEDELLALSGLVDFAFFAEARSRRAPGPYDVAFVEGSITTEEDARRIQEIRADSRVLVTIGACATAGGIQALRNWADVEEYKRAVYPSPELISSLALSTPIATHVRIDHEISGCPIDKRELLGALRSLLSRTRPALPGYSVCLECKRRGNVCVVVARGEPCLGPVTRAGCGALCPALSRGCYGCFGPSDDPNVPPLAALLGRQGLPEDERLRRLRGINGYAPALRRATEKMQDAEHGEDGKDGEN